MSRTLSQTFTCLSIDLPLPHILHLLPSNHPNTNRIFDLTCVHIFMYFMQGYVAAGGNGALHLNWADLMAILHYFAWWPCCFSGWSGMYILNGYFDSRVPPICFSWVMQEEIQAPVSDLLDDIHCRF